MYDGSPHVTMTYNEQLKRLPNMREYLYNVKVRRNNHIQPAQVIDIQGICILHITPTSDTGTVQGQDTTRVNVAMIYNKSLKKLPDIREYLQHYNQHSEVRPCSVIKVVSVCNRSSRFVPIPSPCTR